MKCVKCGYEIKDSAKFCPRCGEMVKEEKKVKFCPKCGSEVREESAFCPKCGAHVGAEQKKSLPEKQKKQGKCSRKLLIIAGAAAAVAILLIIGGIMLNSDKAMYKAYVRFHEEYCDKNMNYENFNDCAARIIMSPENEKWLAIWDITNVRYDEEGDIEEGSAKDKITLYRYKWGKVKKVATFSKKCVLTSNTANFFVIDDELYIFLDYEGVSNNDYLEGIYRLNDKNRFEPVRVKERSRGDEIKYITDSGMELSDFLLLGNYIYDSCYDDSYGSYMHNRFGRYNEQLQMMNAVMLTDVNEFADVVDELSGYKIKNQTDLQVAYGNILKEFGFIRYDDETDSLLSGYPVVGTVKTKYGCYLVRTSGNAELIRVSAEKDLYKALESADGRKVTRIECVRGADIPKNLKIPEGITYINGFWEQEKLKTVELPDTIREIGGGAFAYCTDLQQIELPDSLEKIGWEAFEGCSALQQVELPDFLEKIGEDAFYVAEGLPPVIVASEGSYGQWYAEDENLEWAAKKLRKEELEKRKLIGEALDAYQDYIDEFEEDEYGGEYGGVTLGYVNDDDIPECFMWKEYRNQSYWLSLTMLSYVDGGIISQDTYAAFDYGEFTYGRRTGKVCGLYWVRGEGEAYTVYNLADKFEVFAEVNNLMAGLEEEYTVNGQNYGSEAAVKEYLKSLELNDSFTEDDVYYSVREAYDYLEK